MRKAQMLRVYLAENDRIFGRPATEAVFELCRQAGLSGATVVRAIEGMGRHGVHTTSFLSLSDRLPLILEAVDEPERIARAVELLREHVGDRLVVTWPVEVMRPKEEGGGDD